MTGLMPSNDAGHGAPSPVPGSSRMPRRRRLLQALARRPWLQLLLLGLLLGFAFQGSRGLWGTDEGRYVDGAVQMLASGDYLLPAYGPDRINLSKPPLTYWVIAGAVAAFGYNTWAVRTPYALAFVLTLMALYAMGKRLSPSRPWLPGLIYGCSALPFLSASVVNTDVLLTLCEALAALGFVRWWFGARQRADLVLLWLGLGLAFLTKGPPGLILLLALIPFVFLQEGPQSLGRVFHPLGIGVFLVVGLLWYGVAVWHDPRALHYFLHREIYERIFTAALRRNPGPWGWAKVYPLTLALGLLPWWPVILRKLRRARLPIRSLPPWLRQHPRELFLWLWLLVPLVMFCMVQSRLPLYILPLFLPLSLLLASGQRPVIDLQRGSHRKLLVAWVALLLVGKGVASCCVHPASDHAVAARELAALAPPRSYAAVVFVENVETDYKVEERTPWGLRLYLRKPVYGLAWYVAGHTERLCHALHANHSALLLLAAPVAHQALAAVKADCPVRSITPVGVWRRRELAWVKT